MDSSSVGTCGVKPVPRPRRSNRNFENRETNSLSPKPTDSPSDINSNIDNLLESQPNMSKFNSGTDSPPPRNRPVPRPRRIVPSNGTTTNSQMSNNIPDLTNVSSAPQSFTGSVRSEDYEDDVDDDLYFANVASHPRLQHSNQDPGRQTINIFATKDKDGFEDGLNDKYFGARESLSAITFRSPIEDLDEAARSRISIASLSSSTTTTSKSSSDYSDVYMEPPPARPLPVELTMTGGNVRHSGGAGIPHSAFSSNTVPKKPKRNPNIVLPRLSSLDEGEVPSSPGKLMHGKKSVEKAPSCPPSSDYYEPISSYGSSPTSRNPFIDNGKKFHTISASSTKSASRRNSDNIFSSNNLSKNTAEFNLPINSNFSNQKRVTVPNVDRSQSANQSSSLSNHHTSFNAAADYHRQNHHSQTEPANALRKFDPTAYDISDVHKYNIQERLGSLGLSSGGVIKRGSPCTPPKASQESSQGDSGSERSSVILRRHSSGRSTCSSVGSSINGSSGGSKRDSNKTRKTHEYDEVAIEDGAVVFLTQANSDSGTTLNNDSCSSLTSRYSVVREFDPLCPSALGQGFPVTGAPLDLNDSKQHRYEFIDTDGEDGAQNSWESSSTTTNEEIPVPSRMGPLCLDNPSYSPSTPRNSREIKLIDEMYEPVASPKEGISPKQSPKPRMGTKVLRKDGILPPTPSPPVIVEEKEMNEKPLSTEPGTVTGLVTPPTVSPPSGSQPTTQGNFFRKFSSKFRLNSIKEEKDDKKSTESLLSAEDNYGSLTTPCKKCCEPHPESTKCKFAPKYREGKLYSGDLYRLVGLSKREFGKKRGVLSKGKLGFQNEEFKIIQEISLEKFCVVSKRNDYKVAQSQSELKCFELGLSAGKNNSYVFAAGTEYYRCEWMQNLIEVYTTAFSSSILQNFDRAGWCFIKETVTSDWRPGWLILKERTLYFSYWRGDEPYQQMDLRKARSVGLSKKEEEHKCPYLDNADVLTVDFVCKLLYIQTENSKVTANWEKAIKTAATFNGSEFHEMQLTLENVPVIVDECIKFLYAHGLLSEGIYRQSGSNTRITQLLEDFTNDAWSVQISHKEFSAHDVAGTLKRFFRKLPEPLVTASLYDAWILTARNPCVDQKMAKYMQLLDSLPEINFNILKKLICHLHMIHELHEKNLMPLANLAPIWGPTLMSVDSSKAEPSYEISCAEGEVIKDMIENYIQLFRIDPEEMAREKKMQDALENFHLGSIKRKCSGDMKVWIYVWTHEECINITLTPNSTTQLIVQQICSLKKIENVDNLTLYEVIRNETLERPLHPSEKVIESVLRWSLWDNEGGVENYLVLKQNTLYPSLVHYATEPKKISGELKYADSKSKSFRKLTFQFNPSLNPQSNEATLKYYKDAKATSELGSWKIDDIIWYLRCEPKRNAPTKWTFTIVTRNYKFNRSKEEPFFGNVIVCASEDEMHKWLGALVIGEHPATGLYPIVV